MKTQTPFSIKVRFFAGAREVVGVDVATIELPAKATVATLRQLLGSLHPGLSDLVGRSRFAVNDRFTSDREPLAASDEVALIPPVSGG